MSLQRKFRGNQKMKLYIDGLKDKYIRSFFTTAQGAAQTPYANKAVRAALDMEDIIWVRSKQAERHLCDCMSEVVTSACCRCYNCCI